MKQKLKSSVLLKVILGMILAALLTTSVFAATGLLNPEPAQTISTSDLQEHIKDKIIEQLEAKINELLTADNNSELNKMVADKINKQEVIDALKAKVQSELSNISDIDYSQVDKVISDTIDELLDTTINTTVKVAIDNALANIDVDNTFTVDEALRTSITSEVQNQINKIIDDNLDSIISDVMADVNINKPGDTTPPTTPPVQPSTDEIDIDADNGLVSIDPPSEYDGQMLSTYLEAKKAELNLEYENGQYGMYIKNIANLITTPYYAVKEGDKLIEYDYYISIYENDDYAQTGPSSTVIRDGVTYKFLLDGYSTGTVIAEITTHQPGDPAYQVNLWGRTQSNSHYNWVLSINKDLEQGKDTKVQDVLELFKFNITSSGTGYQAFEYAGNRISQSTVVNGNRAFVPTVYKVSGSSLSYAKGVTPEKSSVEKVATGTTAQYYFANEWDGTTSSSDVTFE